jgi:CRISPR/Cas system-associated exonuclease Cas4 (RecB family)
MSSSKQLANGTIGSVDVKGPFEGKFGQFNVHVFDVDGVEFKKFDKKVNLVKSGDEVQLIFEISSDSKSGKDFNLVKTLEVVGHNGSAVVTKKETPVAVKASVSSAKSSVVVKSNDYAAGAIKGNSVTNGVNIAIAHARMSGIPLTLDDIVTAAKMVQEVHKLLDEEGK